MSGVRDVFPIGEDGPKLPGAMVERAARVLYNGEHTSGRDWWATAEHETRQLWRVKAAAALLEALDGCDVRDQFYVRGQWEDGSWWRSRAADEAEAHKWLTEGKPPVVLQIVRELVITTPVEVASDAG